MLHFFGCLLVANLPASCSSLNHLPQSCLSFKSQLAGTSTGNTFLAIPGGFAPWILIVGALPTVSVGTDLGGGHYQPIVGDFLHYSGPLPLGERGKFS